jgi:hypothetical protein
MRKWHWIGRFTAAGKDDEGSSHADIEVYSFSNRGKKGRPQVRFASYTPHTTQSSKYSTYEWLSVGLYNFCRGHGSLKSIQDTHVQHRSPAMAAKLTDHIWTVREWLLCPVGEGQG